MTNHNMFNVIGDKWCSACRIYKPLSQFNRDASRPSGYTIYCKSCRHPKNVAQKKAYDQRFIAKGDNCWYCGITLVKDNRTTDHVIPKIKGGTNRTTNLVACCVSCNCAKNGRSLEEFRALRKRQRDGIPYFEKAQLEYLTSAGFVFPNSPPFLFWFETQEEGR